MAVLTASLYGKKTKKKDFTRPFNRKMTTLRMSYMYIHVYTYECTVKLESHRHFCCRKKGEAPRRKPRYYDYFCYAKHAIFYFLFLMFTCI